MKKKISVIIPCYNAEEYIAETLDSLEKQIFTDFEVVIINDGSSDNSEKIIRDYMSGSKLDIIYIYQENAGVSAARNNAIKNVNGKYILFLDADDKFSKYMLSVMAEYAEKDIVIFSKLTRNISECENCASDYQNYCIDMDMKKMYDVFLYRKPAVNFCNILYETEILNRYSISFSSDLKYGEDNEFMWKYLIHFNKGKLIDVPLYGYRIAVNSATNKKTPRIKDAEIAIIRAAEYSKKYNEYAYEKLSQYMLPRTKIMIAKDFVRQQDKNAFDKYCTNNYTLEDHKKMKIYANGTFEKIADFLLYYCKSAFYNIIKCYYFFNKG